MLGCLWDTIRLTGEDDYAVYGSDDDDDDDDVDAHVVDDDDDDDDAKEVIQSSTSLPRGNQVDGLPRACSLVFFSFLK